MLKLFLTFFKYGCLAWGGPIAQIALIKEELIVKKKWITISEFNKVLGLYQMLPGPEATELCIYLGLKRKGKTGGLLAGLGFFLPGFILMLAASIVYFQFSESNDITLWLTGLQAAVIALIVRGVINIGRHSIENIYLFLIAGAAFGSYLAGVHFLIIIASGGLLYLLYEKHRMISYILLSAGISLAAYLLFNRIDIPEVSFTQQIVTQNNLLYVIFTGLKAGAFTFGGAYTAIPLVQNDAVLHYGWLTNKQFLDGIAISGVLPAPLIIFTAFAGYAAAGIPGAVIISIMTFAPAFLLTLFFHDKLQAIIENNKLHSFLTGITAAVTGLIAATAIQLMREVITSYTAAAIALISLIILLYFKQNWIIPVVIILAGAAGILLI